MFLRTRQLIVVVALPVLSILVFAAAADAREWTSSTGQYSVEAKLLELTDDGFVRLQKTYGKIVRIPLDKLCLRDQRYARDPGAF